MHFSLSLVLPVSVLSAPIVLSTIFLGRERVKGALSMQSFSPKQTSSIQGGRSSMPSARQLPASCVPVARHCYQCAGKVHGTFLLAIRFILQGSFNTATSRPAAAGSLNRTEWEYRK